MLTYGELHDAVCRVATGLRALGVRSEDRVAVVVHDSVEFAAAFLGALRLGAVPVPVNPLLPGRDAGVIAADARARVAVVGALGERIADLAAAAPELETLVTTTTAPALPATVRVVGWDELCVSADGGEPWATWAESPGFWLCTSGTTGRPKLAMHRHADIRTTCSGYAREVLGITAADTVLSAAPMFHAFGLGNSLTFPLSAGASAVLEPTRPPAPALVEGLLRRHRPTLFFAVPTVYASLLAADLPEDSFASVRQAVSAGEALPAELFGRFQRRFGVEILDGIGSTEMTHIFISNRPGQAVGGTSGSTVPGHEVRLLAEDGTPVAAGAPGALWVSGSAAATGYWCRAEQTRATFVGRWTATNDLYAVDEAGHYRHLGRVDDMLKVGGEWVSPTEVEAVLLADPAVVEAAVVGETTADGLTLPVAFVVGRADAVLDTTALAARCHDELAGYKRPRRFLVVESLPKTATGKVRRNELRDQANEPAAREGATV